MRVRRICRDVHARDALSGRGGLFASGRWHSRGRRVVYTSESLALAALEVLVHVDLDLLPEDLVQIEIKVPDRLARRDLEPHALPARWRRYPAPGALQEIGDRWLAASATPLQFVPSCIIPEENNVLIDPTHSEARAIQVVARKRFRLDPRLG